MKWIYSPVIPEHLKDKAKSLRMLRAKALKDAPYWMRMEALSNENCNPDK